MTTEGDIAGDSSGGSAGDPAGDTHGDTGGGNGGAQEDSRETWWLWGGFERALANLSGWGAAPLFGGFLAWFVGWSVLVGLALKELSSAQERLDLSRVAGNLMPAIGTLFGFLTAFVIANQWNRSRDAQRIIGQEADAGIRLALASGATGLPGHTVRDRQLSYLRSVLDAEWPTLATGDTGWGPTRDELMLLQREVRDRACEPGVPDPVASELALAATEVATTRRDRLNLAGHDLPAPLFLLAVVSGVVLCISAVALVVSVESWIVVIVGGLVVAVALDLALVVAISDPFRGSMRVMPRPLVRVRDTLAAGGFGEVAANPGADGGDSRSSGD